MQGEKQQEQILEKERCGREIVGEDFGKKAKKTWKENFERDSRRKKDVGRKFKKIAI